MQLRRVVVTGLGVVSPNGMGSRACWTNLLGGVSGIREITEFDTSEIGVRIAATIPDWDPDRYMDRKDSVRNDRVTQFAIAASDEALRDAGAVSDPKKTHPPDRVGVFMSSGIGGIQTLEQQCKIYLGKGARKISPFLIPRLIINLIAGTISIRHDLRGPSYGLVSACATGTHSIGESFRYIRYGHADMMVAGGAEAAITPLTVASFHNMKALSTRNELGSGASSPFDRDRDGFVIGEGSVCLVLEELEAAVRRQATIYCEIVGYGATSDAYHITAPRDGGEGLVRSMGLALGEAGLSADSVQYINAHGTSTPFNDKFETMAIKTVFGDRAPRIPISSTKSMVGHLLGGAGAIGAFVCVQTIKEGRIHPTTNYRTPDPECDLDYVPNEARSQGIDIAVANSMGFGGQNATLVFQKFTR